MAAGPKNAPRMKPGAGGVRANAINDPASRSFGKKTPAKRTGKSGDNPRGNRPSPFVKKK